jgi:hypothetical protein
MSHMNYFLVLTREARFSVSTAMAAFLEEELDSVCPPEWVTFVDLHGSRIRLRTQMIEMLFQSTAEQRAAERTCFARLAAEKESGQAG